MAYLIYGVKSYSNKMHCYKTHIGLSRFQLYIQRYPLFSFEEFVGLSSRDSTVGTRYNECKTNGIIKSYKCWANMDRRIGGRGAYAGGR